LIQTQADSEFWLMDFGSQNGTYLNGNRIVKPTQIHSGDRIRIGSHIFIFHQIASEPPREQLPRVPEKTVAEILSQTCWLLVADIINSTELVRQLTPEELPQVTGRWVAECRQIIEGQAGRVNQFMGDGFFAYWRHREQIETQVAQALNELRQLQEQSKLEFRFATHMGWVTIGGVSVGEEERISGSEVHFVFRMEKLAGQLGERRLLSALAKQRLGARLPTRRIGSHALHGFEGTFPFHAF
jgi:class 3 adenylate cyclase